MIYYIDGYNLLFSYFEDLEKSDPLKSEVLHQFVDQVERAHLKVVVVFDAYKNLKQLSRFDFRSVEVVFTHEHQKADDYFLETLSFLKNKKSYTFVSDDKSLCRHLKELKGLTLSFSKFFKILKNREKKHLFKEEKKVDPSLNDHYHQAFSKKANKSKS